MKAFEMFRKNLRKAYLFALRQINPIRCARKIGVKVGNDCRFVSSVVFGSEPYLITIGNKVQITADVRFVTHDGGIWIFNETHPEWDLIKPIRIGNNVYVGLRTIIMPGVTIGDNVIIGAGSVVTRNIPANSVAAGVPARVLRNIDDYREKLEREAIAIKTMDKPQKRAFLERKYMQK